MKKVLLITTTILLLTFPYAYLLAGAPSSSDRIHIITGQNQFIQPPNPTSGNDNGSGGGDEDRGDADDLAGVKYGIRPPANSIGRGGYYNVAIPVVRTWWMYFFIHKLF